MNTGNARVAIVAPSSHPASMHQKMAATGSAGRAAFYWRFVPCATGYELCTWDSIDRQLARSLHALGKEPEVLSI